MERKAATGRGVYLVCGEGLGGLEDGGEISDKESVYERMKKGGMREVIERAEEEEVRMTVVVSPVIYGDGWVDGVGKLLTGDGLKGDGEDVDRLVKIERECEFVHVEDLVELYGLLVFDFLSGRCAAPGFVFSGTGSCTWGEAVEEMSLHTVEGGEDKGMDGMKQMWERVFASSVMMRSEGAREVLKWQPRKTKEDFKKALREEFERVGSS